MWPDQIVNPIIPKMYLKINSTQKHKNTKTQNHKTTIKIQEVTNPQKQNYKFLFVFKTSVICDLEIFLVLSQTIL